MFSNIWLIIGLVVFFASIPVGALVLIGLERYLDRPNDLPAYVYVKTVDNAVNKIRMSEVNFPRPKNAYARRTGGGSYMAKSANR